MVNLSVEDRQQLITLLKNVPELATEKSRRELLEFAGLGRLLPNIDASGSTFVAVSHFVSYLASYGRLTYEHEALGLFLNSIKSFVGVEQQTTLDKLLIKYNMMTPIVPLPDVSHWQGKETAEAVYEKIIGENTLRPIAFLERGLQISRSIAYIGVLTSEERWSGTGFLIAPDLLLTNQHVIPTLDVLPDAIFRFNYQENFRGEALKPDEYRAKLDGHFNTNKHLDYTVVQLEGQPGNKWGWLPLFSQNVKKDDRVNIIQHPSGQPKQISLQNNFVEYTGGNIVQYVNSTKEGSSGSPVLNNRWEVVALHHAGGNRREPDTQRSYFRNEGILISSILADLPQAIKIIVDDANINKDNPICP